MYVVRSVILHRRSYNSIRSTLFQNLSTYILKALNHLVEKKKDRYPGNIKH